jgi:hypothetical protein
MLANLDFYAPPRGRYVSDPTGIYSNQDGVLDRVDLQRWAMEPERLDQTEYEPGIRALGAASAYEEIEALLLPLLRDSPRTYALTYWTRRGHTCQWPWSLTGEPLGSRKPRHKFINDDAWPWVVLFRVLQRKDI